MRWPRALGAIAALALLAGAAAAGLSAAERGGARGAVAGTHAPRRAISARTPGEGLPAGPGRDIAERGCLLCHSAMLVAQQRKDSTGWEKTVSLMEKWGAPVGTAERETLMTYLRGHFGVGESARPR